jgi:hypothetical protein
MTAALVKAQEAYGKQQEFPREFTRETSRANSRVPPALTKEQRSLIKLACASIRLHATALAKDAVPRSADGRSQPLALANTALTTIMKGMPHD